MYKVFGKTLNFWLQVLLEICSRCGHLGNVYRHHFTSKLWLHFSHFPRGRSKEIRCHIVWYKCSLEPMQGNLSKQAYTCASIRYQTTLSSRESYKIFNWNYSQLLSISMNAMQDRISGLSTCFWFRLKALLEYTISHWSKWDLIGGTC